MHPPNTQQDKAEIVLAANLFQKWGLTNQTVETQLPREPWFFWAHSARLGCKDTYWTFLLRNTAVEP